MPESESGLNYNVVFEYTKLAGGYAGARTTTSFCNEAEFDEFWARVGPRGTEIVIAKGVAEGEVRQLIEEGNSNPLMVALHEAILPSAPLVNGRPQVSEFMLEMTLANTGNSLTDEGRQTLGQICHLVPKGEKPVGWTEYGFEESPV